MQRAEVYHAISTAICTQCTKGDLCSAHAASPHLCALLGWLPRQRLACRPASSLMQHLQHLQLLTDGYDMLATADRCLMHGHDCGLSLQVSMQTGVLPTYCKASSVCCYVPRVVPVLDNSLGQQGEWWPGQ
jgi:hypothetical protein